MKLLNLRLKYFRQHTDTAIDFADGLTAIVGSNGSGKSTLVEGVAFALYGSRVIRGKVEDVRTRGAQKGARTEVVLLFEQEGRSYRVERSLSDARLYIAGAPDPAINGTREVNAYVQTLLGMDYGEFLSAFFTEQKGLEFLSGARGAAERERFVIRMMGYDKLERAQELLRTERRDCRSEIGGREAALGSREELQARLDLEEGQLKKLAAGCEEAARALSGAERRSQAAGKIFQALEQKKVSYEKAAGILRELEVRLEERQRRCGILESEAAKIARQIGESEGGDFPGRLKAAQSRGAELDVRLKDARDDLNEIERSYREGLIRARSAREEAQRRLHQALARQKKYESLDKDSPCPACGQSLGPSFENVQSEFQALVRDLMAEAAACLEVENKAAVEPARLAEVKSLLESVEKEQEAARQETEFLKGIQQLLERREVLAKEIASLNEELSRLRKEAAAQRAGLDDLGFSADEYVREKGAFDAAARLEQVARLQKVRQDSEHEKQQALADRTRQALDQYDSRREELNTARRKLLVLEQSDIALTQFRKYLNAAIRPRLSELAGEFLADLTDGRYAAVDISPDFSPTVIDENGPRAVISGGEQDILNLCMRLALSHMLVERSGQIISLLILDEVFGSLDENRRGNVLSLLEKLGSRFEQIIVITHFDDLKDAVQNVVYVDYDDAAGILRVDDGNRPGIEMI